MLGARWTAARWGVAGLLGGLALTWSLGAGHEMTARANTPGMVEASGTIALTSGEPGGAQWLYLIDTKTQSFAVYRVDPNPKSSKGIVRLEAARQYRWDLKIGEYNNQPPQVSAIEKMVTGS